MTGTNHSAVPPNFGQTPATLVFLFIFYYVVSSLRRTPVQPATCGLVLKVNKKNTIISILALATSFDICADFSAVPLSVTNGIQNTSNVFSLTCFLEKINNFSAQKVRLLFEPSGMLFMSVALLFTVVGSFTVAYTLQKLHVAQYIFGKSRIIK